jgi:ZIP family zinc transporter
VLEALGWGAVAVSPYVVGALVGVSRPWPPRVIGVVLGFGIGVLISAVSFELADEGLKKGGLRDLAIGLVLGGVAFFAADALSDRWAESSGGAGKSLVVGAFLDSVPETLVLGVGLAKGLGVSAALLIGVMLENLPESMGSSVALKEDGVEPRRIVPLWVAVAVVSAIAAPVGFVVADALGEDLQAFINGFVAGALLVMIVDSMAPEASERAGRLAGIVTTLGFAAGVALS